jgi:hypothetical protein
MASVLHDAADGASRSGPQQRRLPQSDERSVCLRLVAWRQSCGFSADFIQCLHLSPNCVASVVPFTQRYIGGDTGGGI